MEIKVGFHYILLNLFQVFFFYLFLFKILFLIFFYKEEEINVKQIPKRSPPKPPGSTAPPSPSSLLSSSPSSSSVSSPSLMKGSPRPSIEITLSSEIQPQVLIFQLTFYQSIFFRMQLNLNSLKSQENNLQKDHKRKL